MTDETGFVMGNIRFQRALDVIRHAQKIERRAPCADLKNYRLVCMYVTHRTIAEVESDA